MRKKKRKVVKLSQCGVERRQDKITNTSKTITMKVIPLIMILVGIVTSHVAYAMGPIYDTVWARGYVEGWSKLPMSNHQSANYIAGYSNGTHDMVIWGKEVHPGSLPNHTKDNYRAFYVGFRQGVASADRVYDETIPPGNGTEPVFDSNNNLLCPSGHHTPKYCAGYIFGYNIEDMGNDPPDPPGDK
jgi:hypothetical protein